jgi:site-specific recombinase XerD
MFLVREQLVDRDIAAVSFGPKLTRALPQYLTVPEQEAALAALAADPSDLGRRDHALIATALLTGLRVAELAALELAHLDLAAGTLRVVRGKGGKDREVPIIPRLAGILRAYLDDVRPRLLDRGPSRFVFVNASPKRTWRDRHAGQPLLTRTLWWTIHHRMSPLVGRPVHPHMLRHSFASRLRAAGADLQLVQGGTRAREHHHTTTIYAHLSTPGRRAAVAKLLETGGS